MTRAMSSSHKGMLVYLCYNHVRTGGRSKLLSSGCLTFSVAYERMVQQVAIYLYDFLDSKYRLVLQMATSSMFNFLDGKACMFIIHVMRTSVLQVLQVAISIFL